MRVLIVSSVSPFMARQEIHWAQAIEENLRQQGLQVDTLMLPIAMDPLLLPEQMLAYRLLDVEDSCDLLIAIGYPAFVLRHPRKRVLLFSLASHLHEWYNTEYGILSTPQYERIRQAVVVAEKRGLEECERIISASRALASRLHAVHQLRATPLVMDHGMPAGEDGSSTHAQGSWLVCESTLEPFERVDLILSALVVSQADWRLELFIPSASDVYYRALEQRIQQLTLSERVNLSNQELSQARLATALGCIATPFASTRIPDAVIRAVKSHVPVIAAFDSSAVLEIVRHKKNGLVVEPSAFGVAQAADQLALNHNLREQLSQTNQVYTEKLLNVDAVVKGLMA